LYLSVVVIAEKLTPNASVWSFRVMYGLTNASVTSVGWFRCIESLLHATGAHIPLKTGFAGGFTSCRDLERMSALRTVSLSVMSLRCTAKSPEFARTSFVTTLMKRAFRGA